MPNFNRKNILYIAFFTSLVSATFMIGLFVFLKPDNNSSRTPIADRLRNFVLDEEEKIDSDTSVLLLGYGGAGHSGGGLADANVVLHVDNLTKQISIIAIPRDLWVKIPVRSDLLEQHKINAAFAIGRDDNRYGLKQPEFKGQHGGGNMAKHVVSEVLGLEIDYYAAIDFQRFKNAIDALGGIAVDVPVSFTDRYFPIPGNEELLCGFSPEYNAEINEQYSGFELEKKYECRYETLEFSKGETKMDGDTALKFIRSRHSDVHGGDFARGERAQAVLIGIGNRLISLDAINNIDSFFSEYRRMLASDIDQEVVLETIVKHPDINNYKTVKINIDDRFVTGSTSSDGQAILIPTAGNFNFQQIQNFILESITD